MKTKSSRTASWKVRLTFFAVLAVAATCMVSVNRVTAAGPTPGAIFTTNSSCNGTNINIFTNKDNVYVDGGPAHVGAAGLPDGFYYIQVTEPGGAPLGSSVLSGNPTPIHVTGGEFDQCYQLSAVVIKFSDSTPGYDTTTNGGGEYKVWVSADPSFPGGSTKTDNFKVQTEDPIPPQGDLSVIKFYDANANGINDGEQLITGWRIRIQDDVDYIRFTPVTITLFAPDDYTVTESDPLETNWVHTTANPVSFTLHVGETKSVEFGNLCLGAGGGKTLGFWSNKNGQAQMNDGGSDASELALLTSKNLRNANGSNFDPTTYTQFRTWILGATATNMAYMLSAQMAAMQLNVEAGFVNPNALIYAPGTNSANGLGFASVGNVLNEANAELGLHATAISGDSWRAYQEALKNALDNANNNMTFVQAAPCPFTF